MKFFFDNCLNIKLTRAIALLCEGHHEVVHLTQKFHASTPDTVWLAGLRLEGNWIIVSGDERISTARQERAAWEETGLTAFFLGSGFAGKRFWIQAQVLISRWEQIQAAARDAPHGAGYLVPAKGSMRQIFP